MIKKLKCALKLVCQQRGRKILGKAAAHTLINGLPKIVDQAIMYQNIDQQALQHQVTLKLDQTYIRNQLEQQHLVAFVANNAILPRKAVYPMSQ